MTKAAGRKRLQEARLKCGKVFMGEMGAVPMRFNNDLFAVMTQLDKLINKLK